MTSSSTSSMLSGVPAIGLSCPAGDSSALWVTSVCHGARTAAGTPSFPLHAAIQDRCRALGVRQSGADHLAQDRKRGPRSGPRDRRLPRQSRMSPNAVIKNDIEFVLMQRKPGGYRKPSLAARNAQPLVRSELQVSLPANLGRHHWCVDPEIIPLPFQSPLPAVSSGCSASSETPYLIRLRALRRPQVAAAARGPQQHWHRSRPGVPQKGGGTAAERGKPAFSRQSKFAPVNSTSKAGSL